MIVIGLASVCSQKLATLVDLVADSWNLMVSASSSQETEALAVGAVSCQDSFTVSSKLVLRQQGRGKVKRVCEPNLGWDIFKELFGALYPYLLKHF